MAAFILLIQRRLGDPARSMTISSVSLADVRPTPLSRSLLRISPALTRFPLWARAMGPYLESMRKGWMFLLLELPVVE